MIRNFRHKGLDRFFRESDRRGVDAKQADRIRRILDRLDVVARPEDMALSGYAFQPLKGDRKGTYSVSVPGNWRITFGFVDGDATDVNWEDYH